MSKKIFLILSSLILIGITAANATVIDFENVTNSQISLLETYEGFKWDGNVKVGVIDAEYVPVLNQLDPDGYVAFSGIDSPVVITRENCSEKFELNQIDFISFNDNSNFKVIGSLENQEIYSLDFTVGKSVISQEFNFIRIDQLEIYSNSCVWAIDNFNYNPAPVPEPATILLFGLGLIGLSSIKKIRT